MRALDARLGERAAARAVRLARHDVVAVRELPEPPRVEVDDGEVVLVVKRLDDRRADLAGADDHDSHGGAEGYSFG